MPPGIGPAGGVMEQDELSARLRLAIARIARQLRQDNPEGLTLTQLSTLVRGEEHQPVRPGQRATPEGLSPPALTPAAVMALTASTAAVAVVGSAGPAAAKVKAPVWTQISSGTGISISAEPTVVRWGQKLVVVWPRQVDPSHSSVFSRVLSPAG